MIIKNTRLLSTIFFLFISTSVHPGIGPVKVKIVDGMKTRLDLIPDEHVEIRILLAMNIHLLLVHPTVCRQESTREKPADGYVDS